MWDKILDLGLAALMSQTVAHMPPGFLDAFKQQQSETEQPVDQPQDPTILTEKDVALINLHKKPGAVINVIGARGTGKTVLAYRLCEMLEKPAYGIFPEEKNHPGFIQKIEITDIEKLPPGITLVIDDLPVIASNRDYNVPFVRQMEKVVPMVRHERKMHLIACTQTGAQADKYFLDCDAAFLKPPSIFYEDVERQAIKRMYREIVVPYFAGKDEEFVKRYAIMVSNEYVGPIRIKKIS